jgi:hypothetical protein
MKVGRVVGTTLQEALVWCSLDPSRKSAHFPFIDNRAPLHSPSRLLTTNASQKIMLKRCFAQSQAWKWADSLLGSLLVKISHSLTSVVT